MFRRIANILNFGVFNNFTGGTLPEFAPFNLIYGWNYSGKTTLSRVFRCLEIGVLHPHYLAARFAVTHEDGTSFNHDFGAACNVRVFNEDFRKEHLLWDGDDGFNPILLLGAENIERRNELRTKEEARGRLDAQRTAAVQEAKVLNDTLSRAETDCATQIVKELPVGRFNKTNLRPIIEAWNGILPDTLDDASFTAERAKVTAEQKDILPDIVVNAEPVEDVWREGLALLSEQIGSAATIERLSKYPEIGSWVEQGVHIHGGKARCEFCEGPLSPERLAALNAHFSGAFDNLKKRISDAIEALSNRKMNFSGGAYPRSAFYVDLQTEQGEAGKELGQARNDFNRRLQEMIDALTSRLANPFNIVAAPEAAPDLSILTEVVSRFQKLISANNERTHRFTSSRDDAIAILKRHYAAEAMRKINRFGLVAKINEQENLEQDLNRRLASLDQEISSIHAELSNATKGAEVINDTLKRFFGKADIQVKVTSEDRFLLMRGEEPARNLSEGERTAIAFCYFVTKLLENGNDLSQTIVYIDDPISSLDAHHLLHINAFIKNTFLKQDAVTKRYSCRAKQLFISTHSYEFFHLAWEWMGKKRKKGFAAAYLVERTDANGLVSSRVVACPESILVYKSEYLFLFHQLTAYQSAPSDDPQVIFNLGNMARRFVEAYAAFKFLEHSAIDNAVDQIIPDAISAERARKFMHYYSHVLTRGAGMRLPDMSEAQTIVRLILDAIRDQDPIHYGALERSTEN